uniref:Putative non-classical kazal type inhibitor bdellin-kl hirudo nipponia n=1 Tax=Aedes albopictus TaxID=7160 RepID=A0A023EGG3_AEDAL
MKTAILLTLVSISAVVLARPNQISTDSDFLKLLDSAIAEAQDLHKDDPGTQQQQQQQVQDVNHTSEEVDDDDHSLEHDDDHDHDDHDDGHDFSHEDCDHSEESPESDEYHPSTPAQDTETTTNDPNLQSALVLHV